MTITVDVDDKLIEDGLYWSGLPSKEELLAEALREFNKKRSIKEFIDSFGTFDLEPIDDKPKG